MSMSLIIKTKLQYPKGTVIRLIKMNDIQAPPVGCTGVVDFVDDGGTIHMHWQNGSSLGLIPGEDEFEIISLPKEKRYECRHTI